jgi:hypothetical protein
MNNGRNFPGLALFPSFYFFLIKELKFFFLCGKKQLPVKRKTGDG